MKWINLEILNGISYGNKQHLCGLLDASAKDIADKVSSWESTRFGGEKDSVFTEMHKLKTTFGMLQAGVFIQKCQKVLDEMEKWPSTLIIQEIDCIMNESLWIQEEIDIYLKEEGNRRRETGDGRQKIGDGK